MKFYHTGQQDSKDISPQPHMTSHVLGIRLDCSLVQSKRIHQPSTHNPLYIQPNEKCPAKRL